MELNNYYPETVLFAARVGDSTIHSGIPRFALNNNAQPIQRTWSGFVHLQIGMHTFNIGADDNASAYLADFPDQIVSISPQGPQGGGSFRFGTPRQINITQNGYYKILITYENIAYTPAHNNAAQLEVLLDDHQIILGDILEIPEIQNDTPIPWPTQNIILDKPIEWFEVSQDSTGTPRVIDRGIIDRITPEEFKKLSSILFAEQSQFNLQEHIALASTMYFRWGRGKHGTLDNRTIIKTINSDIVKTTWDSLDGKQYNKALELNGETIKGVERINLIKTIYTLLHIAQTGPVYDYDYVVLNGTSSSIQYTQIGEHDFARVLRYCGRPDWFVDE